MFFRQIRGVLIGKSAMCYASGVNPVLTAIVLLEAVLELAVLGYPWDLLRALVHSLPNNTAAILARRVVRTHLRFLSSMGRPGGGSGKGNYFGGRGDDNRKEKREEAKPRRHSKGRRSSGGSQPRRRRPSNSSSSSSSVSRSTKASRKAKEAQKTLFKHDTEFKAFLEAKAQREQEEFYKKQSEALSAALSSKFEDSIKAAAVAGAKAVGVSNSSGSSGGYPTGIELGTAQNSAFSSAQLAQLGELIAAKLPQQTTNPPVVPPGGAPPSSAPPRGQQPQGEGTLSPLQRTLLNSWFAGKVMLAPEDTIKEFQEKIKDAWTQRSVVDALGQFITEQSPDAQVPRGKDEGTKMFWDLLSQLR